MQYYQGARATHEARSQTKDLEGHVNAAGNSVKEAWNDMPTYREIRQSETVTNAVNGATSGWQSLKKSIWGNEGQSSMSRSTSASPSVVSGHTATDSGGSTTWGRLVGTMVEASGKVSRAVNRDAGYESDEDGYKGESHLSRIITEYHMNKARTLEDLPDWLRREQQSQGGAGGGRAWDARPTPQPSRSAQSQSGRGQGLDLGGDSGGRGSGLRDIYDSAANSSYSSNNSQSHGRSSSATDRLRQLREQKQRSHLAPEPSYSSAPTSRSPSPSHGGYDGRRDEYRARDDGAYDSRRGGGSDPYARSQRDPYARRQY